MCQAVAAAWKAGITVVVSAGMAGATTRWGTTIRTVSRQQYWVITVGAIRAEGAPIPRQRPDHKLQLSNWPGVYIYLAGPVYLAAPRRRHLEQFLLDLSRVHPGGVGAAHSTSPLNLDINSTASWSADGTQLAIAAKKGERDDIVIIDPKRNKEIRRIKLKLSGALTPSWSPDGTKLVFTGLDGGISISSSWTPTEKTSSD